MEIAIGAALISTTLRPLAANAMDIIKDKAVDKAVDKAIAMVVDKVDGIVNIERDISKLQETLGVIEGIVQVAEEKQIDKKLKKNQVSFIQNWLRDLVDIAYEARDVLEDFITFSSCTITAEEASNPVIFIFSLMLSCCCGLSRDTSKLPLATLNRLAKDIRSVRERFDEMTKKGETFTKLKSVVGGEGSASVHVDHRPEVGPSINRDALFLGREEVNERIILEKILHPSDDNRVHVVAIWGMGGIGKTTLAQSIYNDERVKEDEYPTKNRRWLCVGENKFSAKEIIKEIVNDQNIIGIGNLQTKLKEKLRGDRFLIVLDDVWDVDGSEWELLFNPLTDVGKGLKGGLIIITTRKREVCTVTNTQTTYDLKPLSEKHSWSIFESRAFVDGNSDSRPDLKGIGKDIVRKLNGHPLALKVVGRSLLGKDSSTWTNFLESKLTKDDEVMSALRWSYNHLPRHLKMCFTYCALFPKDHVFDNEKVLVEMWMAHDLIQINGDGRPEDIGTQYFKELTYASLIQCVDERYVMHDMIHDLALHVSNEEFSSAIGSLSTDRMKKVRHITIISDYEYSKNLRSCKSKRILTIYTPYKWKLFERSILKKDILFEVFKQSKSLRVLVLSNEYISEIPECMSELKHLRYLDVSYTSVKSLPDSLCHLYNLQMLAAPLDAVLPRDIVNIRSLRYLRANLPTCRGIEKLTSLQELSSISVCEGDNIRELGVMRQLRGKLKVKGLENISSSQDAAQTLMQKKLYLDELELGFSRDLGKSSIVTDVLNALGCPPNLKCLKIVGYTGVKPPSWMVDGNLKFDKLQKLELYDCPKLESLPPLGELTSLKDLSLGSVGVKRLGDEFYGNFTDGKEFFPSLESLVFYDMNEWEEWDDIIIENSSVSFFPRLTKLTLFQCPKLESLPPLGELTSLKDLSLGSVGVKRLGDEFYGKFTDGKVFFPSLESLEFFEMEEWEEWDDIIIENSYMLFFPHLTRLNIHRCSKLVSVLPVVKNPIMNAANFMTSLSSLKIWICDGLKRLQLDALVSLKDLDISCCKSLVQITSAICESLEISSCRLLEKMDVARCDSLVVIKILKLEDCESLRSLSIDIHGLDSLEHLDINDCPKLESIPPLGELTSLKHLSLVNVRVKRLGDEFYGKFTDGKVFFPCLESLSFDGMNEWEEWEEWEEWDDIIIKNSSVSFFPRLTTLEIKDCAKLVSVLPVVKNPIMNAANFMTSLSRLRITECPQLHSLPADGFPPSLSNLIIEGCPLLYERCRDESGPDWHKINHIRRKNILP